MISTHSGVGLVEKVKALLVNFVLRVTFTDTARPFNTFVHNVVTDWFHKIAPVLMFTLSLAQDTSFRGATPCLWIVLLG